MSPTSEEIFLQLCKEEGLEVKESEVRKVFRRYKPEEVDRLVAACIRFGVKNVLDGI